MVDILHKISTRGASPDQVLATLTTPEGLAGWWTTDTTGDGGPGGTLEFRFDKGGFDMEVLEVDPGAAVRWRVVDGPEEWVDTTVEFELRPVGDDTVVLFAHRGWREPVEFMHHCSTKWATFLLSLKALHETGAGSPAPHDVKIDDWN